MITACQLVLYLSACYLEDIIRGKARSGVDVEIHRLEKKVGGSLGSFNSSRLFSICQSSTSSPLRSLSSYPQLVEWLLKSPTVRQFSGGRFIVWSARSLSKGTVKVKNGDSCIIHGDVCSVYFRLLTSVNFEVLCWDVIFHQD